MINTSGKCGILKGVWVQGLGSSIFRVVTPRVFHVTPGPLRKPLKLLATSTSTGRKRHFFHYTETLPSFLAFISGDRISDFQQVCLQATYQGGEIGTGMYLDVQFLNSSPAKNLRA